MSAFPFGQSVKGFGKQFILTEYVKPDARKRKSSAFVFVRCEKLREFAFAQIRRKVTSRAARFARVRRWLFASPTKVFFANASY